MVSHSLVMRIGRGVLPEGEELPELGEAEVPRHVLLAVDHAGTQRLLVALALQDLLLDRTRLKSRFIFLCSKSFKLIIRA